MIRLTDNELLDELRNRFQENKKALHDLKVMTRKLEALNKRLQESEALKSNFLSNIRNEIVNPLSSIMGLSKQLATGKETDREMVSSIANLVHAEAFNLDFQLKNIFVAAEIEAGEAVVTNSRVDIIALINSTIETFSQIAEEKKVQIELVLDWLSQKDKELNFNTDPEKLHFVLSNLLANAIEFNKERGIVTLNVWREERLHITIKDTGLGIDDDEQDVIFDRFKQIESGTTKSHRGHGLGLSITKAVVDLLNGTISLSSAKDQGATFTITLPELESGAEVDVFSGEGNEFLFEEEQF